MRRDESGRIVKIDLSGKIALITGGSRGIGGQISVALSHAGAVTLINYGRSSEAAEELKQSLLREGFAAETLQADVGDPEKVASLFELIRARYGKLDILVNNAGITRDRLLMTTKTKDWDEVHDVNLRGAFLCSRHATELMVVRHYGKIINISSVAAIRGTRGNCAYASSKGGLISFTIACASELAGKNIQVNAVLPGFVRSDMTRRILGSAESEILSRIPAGRLGMPADVAPLVLFLASDFADYITGQAIAIDGGLSL